MTDADIDHMFTYHAPTDEQKVKYEAINSVFRAAAKIVLSQCPGCAEQTIAIRKLQEGRMMANAAIALEPFLPPNPFELLPGETEADMRHRKWPNICPKPE